MTQSHAIYLHIPFCLHRCAYCDFNTYAGQMDAIPAYVDVLCHEIEIVAQSAGEKITARTIFFGGGTPSLLSDRQFGRILDILKESFELLDPEVSLEANPGTVNLESLCKLHDLGFNRISFGVQSFHPDDLGTLERIHAPSDVFNAFGWARRAGFKNINLDLIFGLPEQTSKRWSENLQRAVALHPEHLSLYALTIEQGTPFGRWMERGLLPIPDPDLAAHMYEIASEFLDGNGYYQYEISNWSKPGYACQHNLQYWRDKPYLGFGAGAHGYAGGVRYSNVKRISTYIDHLKSPKADLSFPLSPATVQKSKLSPWTEMQETMMLGLRLTQEGVEEDEFQARFGTPMQEIFGNELDRLTKLGLLERHAGAVRLTQKGRLLGNQVFMNFVN